MPQAKPHGRLPLQPAFIFQRAKAEGTQAERPSLPGLGSRKHLHSRSSLALALCFAALRLLAETNGDPREPLQPPPQQGQGRVMPALLGTDSLPERVGGGT